MKLGGELLPLINQKTHGLTQVVLRPKQRCSRVTVSPSRPSPLPYPSPAGCSRNTCTCSAGCGQGVEEGGGDKVYAHRRGRLRCRCKSNRYFINKVMQKTLTLFHSNKRNTERHYTVNVLTGSGSYLV